MQPDDLRFSIVIDEQETVLKNSPSGWEETFIEWVRNSDYYGMSRQVSFPVIFVLEGARVLREKFYTDGLRSTAQLKVEILSSKTWNYRNPVFFDIDFGEFVDREFEVEITLLESGIKEKIKSFESVEYSIPLDDPEAITIEIPGIGLVEKGNAIVSKPEGFALSFDGSWYVIPEINIVENNFLNDAITFQSVPNELNTSPGAIGGSNLWFITANEQTNISINGTLKGVYKNLYPGDSFIIEIINENLENIYTVLNAVKDGTAVSYEADFDFQYELSENEKLFMIMRGEGVGQFLNTTVSIDEGEIYVSNSLITEPTLCKAFRPFTLFNRIISKINEGIQPKTRSFFLNSANWRRVVITCGDAIRGYQDAEIKTTFKDFFDSFFAISGGVGFGVEDDICIFESRKDWFANIQAVYVGEIKEFSLNVYKDFLFNSIKVGYEDFEYEQEYGREEVNSTQTYVGPMTKTEKNLNLISKYRADQLGIEELRITPTEENENQTDNRSDNDVFMIKIQESETGGIYKVEGKENYQVIEGFTSRNEYYNLDITPKKNLLRHGQFLRSVLFGFDDRSIRFESAKKNEDVKTVDLNGRSITEKDWVPVNTLGEKYFIPYEVSFKCKLPENIFPFLNIFNRGYVAFTFKGIRYKGYALKISVDVAKNSEREFTLLLKEDQNIKNLIR